MRKQNNKNAKYVIIAVVIVALFLLNAIGSNKEPTNETVEITSNKATIQETTTQQIIELEATTAKKIETTTKKKKISKKEYKKQCKELYYDDVFGDNFLSEYEGKKVKLNLFVAQKASFLNDYSQYMLDEDFVKDNNLKLKFMTCCVKHEDYDSYVGKEINIFFNENSKLSSKKYNESEKITLYGEVIMGNFNYGVLAKYIEAE